MSKIPAHQRKGTKGVRSHIRDTSKGSVPNTFTLAERKRIAQTIKEQIGRDTLMFVGANQFMTGEEDGMPYLQFKASGKKIQRGGKIRVLYDAGSDLYNVELWRVNMRAKEPVKRLKHAEGVHVAQLRSTIEDYTG